MVKIATAYIFCRFTFCKLAQTDREVCSGPAYFPVGERLVRNFVNYVTVSPNKFLRAFVKVAKVAQHLRRTKIQTDPLSAGNSLFEISELFHLGQL